MCLLSIKEITKTFISFYISYFFPCVENFSPFDPIEKKLGLLEILQVKKSFNAQFLKLEENLTEITWWQPAHLEAGYSQFVSVVTYFDEF